jgi:cell division protein FtsL
LQREEDKHAIMSEIYYIKHVDNSRWVPTPNSREPHYNAALMLAAAILLGAGLFFARERLQSRESGYQIERLEAQKTELMESNRKLRLEEAALGDPLRIDSIARTELGMTPLAPHQIYRDENTPALSTVVASRRSAEGLLGGPDENTLAGIR